MTRSVDQALVNIIGYFEICVVFSNRVRGDGLVQISPTRTGNWNYNNPPRENLWVIETLLMEAIFEASEPSREAMLSGES